MAVLKNDTLSFASNISAVQGEAYDFKMAYVQLGTWNLTNSSVEGTVNLKELVSSLTKAVAVFVIPNWHKAYVEVASIYDGYNFKYRIKNEEGYNGTKIITALVIYI